MNVLILSDEPCDGLERTLSYIEKTDKNIKVQRRRASQWLPGSRENQEDKIIVHVGVPCRLALPHGYNVLAVGGPYPKDWEWMEQDMNIVLHNLDIETTLPHLPIGKTFRESIETWRRVIRQAKPAPTQTPPIQKAEGKVSIVTITHNRVPWWPNMVQNVLSQSWNQKDIEWVIVDDDQTLIGQVGQLQRDYPDLTVKYVQMQNDIGTKRNAGVKAATSDIVVFMDDDDHYPKDSVYNRVKGLQADCVYCATLPIYDIRHYESSMLGPAVKKLPYQRASVASLAFRKSFWAARPFPEGDSDAEFLKGRELETVELSPKDVIVAFLHKGNPKARFGSDEKEKPKEPNGCHYGFSEKYFTYLHQIGMDS